MTRRSFLKALFATAVVVTADVALPTKSFAGVMKPEPTPWEKWEEKFLDEIYNAYLRTQREWAAELALIS